MSAVETVLAGRAAAEAVILDGGMECIVTRTGEPGPWDPKTGGDDPAPELVYAGPCKIRQPGPADRAQVSGGFEWKTQDAILSVPMSVLGIKLDDEVTITASPLDPDALGRMLSVVFRPIGTFTTARRFVVREAT